MKNSLYRWSAIGLLSLASSIMAVVIVSSVFISCKKTETKYVPTLTTATITDITSTSATAGGQITDNGGEDIIVSGVVYSTSTGPTLLNSFTTDGTTSGSFTSGLSELTANTTYYVRAYATNGAGTAYGDEVSFTTLP